MKEKPKISIVTPVFNCKRYIRSCIENVVSQNCGSLEHIIVDGGSTDGTVEIIKDAAKEYSHIRWLSEPDKGQSDAMNKGVKMARGEIIGTLNADDFYSKDIINDILLKFESLPENSVLIGNCNVWSAENKLKFVNKPKALSYRQVILLTDILPFLSNPSSMFYHKKIHTISGHYDVNEHYSLDLDMMARLFKGADNVFYIDKVLGNFMNIEGTKSFEIDRKNQVHKIQKKLFLKHVNNLDLFEKILLKILFYILHERKVRYLKRIVYYILYPGQTKRFLTKNFWNKFIIKIK